MNAWTLLDAITGNRRDELARFWINAPDDALEHLWTGPIGDATKNLIGKLTPSTQLSQAQLKLRGQMTERLKQGLRQPGALKLMIASFLFMPPGKLKIVNPELNFPAWLLPDYRRLYESGESSPPGTNQGFSTAFPSNLDSFATNRIQLNRLLGLSNLFYIDPEDQEILQELRTLRLSLGSLILDASPSSLEQAFRSELGSRYTALLRSGIQDLALQPEEEKVVAKALGELDSFAHFQYNGEHDTASLIVAMSFFKPETWVRILQKPEVPNWVKDLYPSP